MNKLLRIGEAANCLGYSIDTLRRWDKKGRFSAVRQTKTGYRHYSVSATEEFSKNLDKFRIAKHWAKSKRGFEPLPCYFCSDSFVFQSRLLRLQRDLMEHEETSDFSSLLLAIIGEIGNNSFDHNLGNWPDITGIFFSYDLDKKRIVLVDRGQGILKTLRKVRPGLNNNKEALRVAFTEIISGRSPEHRGNGLKFVKKIVTNSKMKLFFQTGNAKIHLKNKPEFKVDRAKNPIVGCLAKIEF